MALAPDDPGCFGAILWERPISSYFSATLHGDVVFTAERLSMSDHRLSAVSGGRVLVEGRRKGGADVLQIREWAR